MINMALYQLCINYKDVRNVGVGLFGEGCFNRPIKFTFILLAALSTTFTRGENFYRFATFLQYNARPFFILSNFISFVVDY
jgi:hypothetical protein